MQSFLWALLALLLAASCSARAVDVARFIKRDKFGTLSISPDGEYFAATVPSDGTTHLVILKRSGLKLVAKAIKRNGIHVDRMWWVSPSQVVYSVASSNGELERPKELGTLFVLGVDGTDDPLRAFPKTDVRRQRAPSSEFSGVQRFVDGLESDDNHILTSFSRVDARSVLQRVDLATQEKERLAIAPVKKAHFVVDNAGQLRYAVGSDDDNASKLYVRDDVRNEWSLVNDEAQSGRVEWPIGFSPDNRIAYLQVDHSFGPDSIITVEGNGRRTELLRDDRYDPARIVYRSGTRVPIGAWFLGGVPRIRFFDESEREAVRYSKLASAFPNSVVDIVSQTRDGRLAILSVQSDRNPGDYYLYDMQTSRVEHVLSFRDWLDPEQMASTRPITVTARDGLALSGYLTLPNGQSDSLGMVVLPHGGPYGVFDTWSFDAERQLLAAAGYAVLQLNFRGSGGQGAAFLEAGAKEWGGRMQDDLTDATKWAIAEGIARADSICIYGASYGAYAALMGAAKEPHLYKCAVGYVGVYDLAMMYREEAKAARWLRNWNRDWLGEPTSLAKISPNRLADRIKVPVFLAAGGNDEVAPIEHTWLMEKALQKAGVPVESLYFETEGHGFYEQAHLAEFYSRLLGFLSRNIGSARKQDP